MRILNAAAMTMTMVTNNTDDYDYMTGVLSLLAALFGDGVQMVELLHGLCYTNSYIGAAGCTLIPFLIQPTHKRTLTGWGSQVYPNGRGSRVRPGQGRRCARASPLVAHGQGSRVYPKGRGSRVYPNGRGSR